MTLVRLVKRGDFGAGHNVWQATSAADLTNFWPDPGDELIRLDTGFSYACVEGGGLAIKGSFSVPAAPALLTHTVAGSAAGADITTGTIDTTGATVIVAAVSAQNTPAMADSATNTWKPIYPFTINTGRDLGLFYCLNPTTSATHTFSTTVGGTNHPAIAVAAFSGVGAAGGGRDLLGLSISTQQGFQDSTSISANPGTTSLQLPSSTPAQNKVLLVAGLGLNAAATAIAIDSGFTITDSLNFTVNNQGVGLAYLIQSAQAAVAPTWSGLNSGQIKLAQLAAFLHSQ